MVFADSLMTVIECVFSSAARNKSATTANTDIDRG